jgi:hypothetical protein
VSGAFCHRWRSSRLSLGSSPCPSPGACAVGYGGSYDPPLRVSATPAHAAGRMNVRRDYATRPGDGRNGTAMRRSLCFLILSAAACVTAPSPSSTPIPSSALPPEFVGRWRASPDISPPFEVDIQPDGRFVEVDEEGCTATGRVRFEEARALLWWETEAKSCTRFEATYDLRVTARGADTFVAVYDDGHAYTENVVYTRVQTPSTF